MRKTLQRTFGLLFFALVGVMTGTAQNSFPYSVDFTTAGDLAGWTAVDDSPTKGVTWEYGTGTCSQAAGNIYQKCALMPEDATSKHVDYLVSPEFTATAGATYYISIKAQYKGYAMCGVQVGKSATDMSANTVISDDVSSSFGGWNNGWFDYNGVERAKTAKVAYTATEDGPLYFSLYAHSNSDVDDTSKFFVYSIGIEEDKPGPKALPYSVDLGDNQRGWAAIDASDVPGVTWAANEFYDYSSSKYMPAVVNGYDWDNTWNDYYVSPTFTLEAGKSYKVKTRTWKNNDPSAFTLSLMLGTSQTDASTFQKITDLSMQATYDATVTEDHVFAVKKSGDYNLAFLATTTTGTNEQVALCYFDIAETDETPEVTLGGAVETTALPYNITFDAVNDVWTTIDASADPTTTWGFNDSWTNDGFCPTTNPYSAIPSYCILQDPNVVNDYYVSPAFKLEAGKTYTVKTSTGKMYDTPAVLSVEFGTSNTDASSFTKLTNIAMENSGEQYENSYDLTVPADGVYYLAYHAVNTTTENFAKYAYLYAMSFGIEEKTGGDEPVVEAVEVPYEISFASETDAWTALDASETVAVTWKYATGYDGFYNADGTYSSCYCLEDDYGKPNDYFVSPAIKLQAGKTYTVKTNTGKAFNTPAVLSLELGTSSTDATTFNKVSDIEMADNSVQYKNSYDVTVENDGEYRLAFHVTTNSTESPLSAEMYLMDFSIAEKTAPDVTAELPYEIAFDSADKFATWSTLDNSDVPGKTWEFTGSDFAGKPAAFMGPDAGSATCDWLISPRFELQEGKTYVIKMDGDTGTDNATSVILDYFEGSKEKENFKTIAWIGSSLPMTDWNTQEPITEWTLEVTKSGSYYFGFRALNQTPNQEKDAISIYSFSVAEQEDEPETPVTLPYETSFAEEAGAAGWTAMDRSDNVNSTWSYNSWGYDEYNANWEKVGENHPCVSYNCDWSNANDFWVSPLFTLEAGKTYVVKTHTTTNRTCFDANTSSFTMKLGTNKKVQGTFTQTIGDIELSTVYDRDPSVFEFTVEESGNYYVAYNIFDTNGQNAYGYIFDFSIAEKTAEVQPVATTAVTDLAATEAGDLKTIKLTWKNPTKDVDGNDLAADAELSVKVFEGETLLTTVAGAPGAEGSYSYEPETYAGLHEYKVVVVYKELESEAATATLTVVVNGINGAIVIPADAEVSVRTLGGALVGNNFSTLAKGTYLVTVKTVDGKVKTMKITK